jgi:hypothetical protein
MEADIIPDKTEVYIATVPEKTSPSKEKIVHSDDADAHDQEKDGEEEYIPGCVHETPPRRTLGPQTRHRKRIDEATYSWDPATVSDTKKTPLKSAGQPARGRRSTNRP